MRETIFEIDVLYGVDLKMREFLETFVNPSTSNEYLLQAFLRVDRRDFVPEKDSEAALTNAIIDIGEATNSQPKLTTQMLDALNPKPGGNYLVIGTGSGYVDALLAHCAGENGQVTSIEYSKSLAESARERLSNLGYTTITVLHGDAATDYPKNKQYDGIIFTCAIRSIPQEYIDLLHDTGRVVAPIAPENFNDGRLTLLIKKGNNYVPYLKQWVKFMPMITPNAMGWTAEEVQMIEEQEQQKQEQHVQAIVTQVQEAYPEEFKKAEQNLRLVLAEKDKNRTDYSLHEWNTLLILAFKKIGIVRDA